MQNFVKRSASPHVQNAQTKPDRRALAAQAKIKTGGRQPPTEQFGQNHVISALPARGLGNAANTSAAVTKHEPIAQRIKTDAYDSEAGSIDTTVNQSVIQAENHAHRQELNRDIGDYISESQLASDDSADFVEYTGDPVHDYALTQDDVDHLESVGMGKKPRHEAVQYIMRQKGITFGTFDGDSYPTTTEGEPDEPEPKQEDLINVSEDARSESPSPHHRPVGNQQPTFEQTSHARTYKNGRTHNMPTQSKLFSDARNIRSEERQQRQWPLSNQPRGPSHQVVGAEIMPCSQPPTYSQAQENFTAGPIHQVPPQSRRIEDMTNGRNQGDPRRAPNVVGPIPARAQVLPIIQQVPPHGAEAAPPFQHYDGDYDHELLFGMSYDQLKDESFDKDPRASDPTLANDLAEKSLPERLVSVQKNLDPHKQSEFFASLSTTEWEDAGDWFLDQFSSIIKRTKEARQTKRKLARDFEHQVEKRHKHVSNKHQQVEEAMSKMKAQGEGILPRTPRSGKSPRGKQT